ncbi:MAG: trigger factor [Planctomycetota bacterium]|nr:trigger factor [Planctomycetota bacterium]
MADHNHDHDHADHNHDHAHAHGANADTRGEQKVTVEEVGPARKRLTIEVPAERIAKKIGTGYDRLKSDAVVPGFRRGRAPMRLLQRRFGESIRDDTKSQLLTECYTQAIEDEKLEVLGEPEVKDFAAIKLPESGPLVFTVEIEVTPKVELPSIEGIEVNRPKATVNDEDVEKEITSYRERQGKLTGVEGVAVSAGDFILCDVKVLAGADAGEGAEVLLSHPTAYVFVTGEDRQFKGHVVGIIVEDLGKRLIGKNTGETVDISTTGPVSHEHEKIKNQPITIRVNIQKVERLELAPIESLVKQAGLATEADLRDRVRQGIQARAERDQTSAQHRQICNYLLEKVALELPVGLTGRQTARILRREAMDLAYRNVPEHEIERQIAEMRGTSEENARRQLKLFFILDQAAKDLNIDVSEGEVNGRIHMLAMQQGRRPEKVRQQMSRGGEIEQLYLQIREQKTLDSILAKAKITDVDKLPEPAAAQA